MDLDKLTPEQLRTACRILFESRNKLTCGIETIPFRGSDVIFDYCVLGSDIILVSHRVKSTAFDRLIEDVLSVKYNDQKLQTATIYNTRNRLKLLPEQLKHILRFVETNYKEQHEAIFSEIDLDKEAKREQSSREKAKAYAEKKRSQQFTLREQQLIARRILNAQVLKALGKIEQEIFSDLTHIKLRPRYGVVKGNYFVDMACGLASAEHVDLSGQKLFEAIGQTLSVSMQDVLQMLSGDKEEVCRRFVTAFDPKFMNSSLIDKDPRVRMLAKNKKESK